MVGIGMVMILAGLSGVWLWWRGRLLESRWYLWPAQHAWWMGFVAVISGWIVTETGRQPWVAYGILRTADATSPVPTGSLVTSLVLFVLVYGGSFPRSRPAKQTARARRVDYHPNAPPLPRFSVVGARAC